MRVTPPPDSPPPSFWFPFLRFVFKNRLSRVPTTRVVPADNKQTSRGRVSKGRNMLPSITRVPEIKGPAAATGSPAIVKWRAKGKGTTGQTHNWTRIKSKKCADADVFGKIIDLRWRTFQHNWTMLWIIYQNQTWAKTIRDVDHVSSIVENQRDRSASAWNWTLPPGNHFPMTHHTQTKELMKWYRTTLLRGSAGRSHFVERGHRDHSVN
jgi:hypothetical protein